MSDSDILRQMVNPDILVSLGSEHGKYFVNIFDSKDPDCGVKIRNIPADAVVIKADLFKSPDSIFNGTRGECKRADFVIISEDKKCILYIELKRNKCSRNHIVQQLKGAQCVVKYCQEIGMAFWGSNSFLSDYKNRFISIGHISIAKKKTRVTKNSEVHDKPELAMKIDWPHYIEFNLLASLNA